MYIYIYKEHTTTSFYGPLRSDLLQIQENVNPEDLEIKMPGQTPGILE